MHHVMKELDERKRSRYTSTPSLKSRISSTIDRNGAAPQLLTDTKQLTETEPRPTLQH